MATSPSIKSIATRTNAAVWNNLMNKRSFSLHLLHLCGEMNKRQRNRVTDLEERFNILLKAFGLPYKQCGEANFIKYPHIHVCLTANESSEVIACIIDSLKSDGLVSSDLIEQFRGDAEGDYNHTLITAFQWVDVN